MQAPHAVHSENQIAFAFMSESDIHEPQNGLRGHYALGGFNETGLVPVILSAVAAGAVVLGLIASNATEPLLLTLLALFAMLGVFLVFGILAGHIRIGERVREDDLVKAFADNLDDGVLVTRQDGAAVYANRSFRDLAGVEASGDLRGLDMLFSGEPRSAAAFFRLSRAASRGEPWREEIEVAGRKPGEPRRLFRVAERPCSVPGHERELGPMVLWSIQDVTDERARQATAMHSLESTLERLDAAPVGLMEVDGRGVVRRINATFLRWLSLEPVGIAERALKLGDIVSQQGLELIKAAASTFQTVGAGVDLDVSVERGQVMPLRIFARRDGSGTLLVAAYPRETAGASAADAGSAEMRLTRFFQSAPFGIATISADGRVVATNASFARMIPDGAVSAGMGAAQLLCRSASADAQRAVDEGMKQALAGTANLTPIDITVGPKNDVSLRLYVVPLTQAKDAPEAAVLYLIDATEQKALEAKFAQSSKMEAVGKLAGGIAHDFNNVLTAIIGFSDLLLQTHRPTDPAYKDIKNIQQSAYRAAGMVRQLLAFSRRQTQEIEVLQLGDLTTDMTSMLKTSVGEKIVFKSQTSRDLWYVKADRTQVNQVVLNLAVNAKDAMPDGGALTVRTRNITERESQKLDLHGMPVGEYVLLEVEDTGTGMSAEVMAKIFEPFFTTKGVGKGTGLGLATVYGIVKQSGGYIYADSQLGRGTTFRVFLPRYLPENEDEIVAQKSAKKERPQDLTGSGRVLLVEDEDVVRSFAVRALKRQGYEVLEASTGVEALEVMEAHDHKVDIVVSDVVMPEMDGPTLLKELRKKNPELKIIFVSGYPHEAFETSLDKDQQFAFLPKPFSLPQLAAKVKEQLGR